jgi:N-acylneuraminate cytidylyltransferase
MQAIGFIFARGGSKGLPGKNIKLLGGKPLIAWSIEQALSVKRIERLIVSTDSEEIAEISRFYGAEVPFIRPAELAQDETPEWLAWKHALNFVHETTDKLPEIMVSVPTTSPLRLPIDIENCLNEYEKGETDVVISVTDSHRSPYFNMVKRNENGTVSLVIPQETSISRRQEAPRVFDITTVAYVVRSKFVMTNTKIFEGRVRSVYIPIERALDIDTIYDFEIAELLMKKE